MSPDAAAEVTIFGTRAEVKQGDSDHLWCILRRTELTAPDADATQTYCIRNMPCPCIHSIHNRFRIRNMP